MIGGLNRLKIPDWVPGIGGKGINIPLIPTLAEGSRYTPDTFIAGEAGAELITNARGRTVFTAAQTGRIFDNINAAREAQDGTTVVTLLPLLQAALSAARVGAGGVSAPSVTAAEPRGAGIVIHSAPVFHVGSDAQAEDIESDITFLQRLCKAAGISLKVTAKMIVLFDAAAYEQKAAVRTIKRGRDDYSKYTFGTSFHDTAYSSCRVKYTDPTSKTTYEATYTAPDASKDSNGQK